MSLVNGIIDGLTALGSFAGAIALARQFQQDRNTKRARLQAQAIDQFPHVIIELAYFPDSLHSGYVAEVDVLGKAHCLLLKTVPVAQPAFPYVYNQISDRIGSAKIEFLMQTISAETPPRCIATFALAPIQVGARAKIKVVLREASTGRIVARRVWPFQAPRADTAVSLKNPQIQTSTQPNLSV